MAVHYGKVRGGPKSIKFWTTFFLYQIDLQLLFELENLGKTSKKNCIKSENGTIGGEGVTKIIEFSSFTNDEKHGRGVTFHYFIEPNYD